VLDAFCKENNLLFVVKKHFFHRFNVQDLSAYSNIIDITQNEYDTQQLLKKAFVLITDYSSCFVDYLLLDRPIIFYNYDHNTYVLNDRELYFDYEKTTPGPKVKDFSSFMTSLEKVVKEEHGEDKLERERVLNMFYSKANQQKVGLKILNYVKKNIK
jgi:CDP-glycerol glycerophosphotransferase (TagB/SpsB family)